MTLRNINGNEVNIDAGELVSFDYGDKAGQASARLVEVDTVRMSKGGQLIATGFDYTRSEHRTFRVYNMENIFSY